ncbi:hypothetical protein MRB53_038552 [Persea americana]|nr:hypothetical protein MRB53_038552 [Persea americana]
MAVILLVARQESKLSCSVVGFSNPTNALQTCFDLDSQWREILHKKIATVYIPARICFKELLARRCGSVSERSRISHARSPLIRGGFVMCLIKCLQDLVSQSITSRFLLANVRYSNVFGDLSTSLSCDRLPCFIHAWTGNERRNISRGEVTFHTTVSKMPRSSVRRQRQCLVTWIALIWTSVTSVTAGKRCLSCLFFLSIVNLAYFNLVSLCLISVAVIEWSLQQPVSEDMQSIWTDQKELMSWKADQRSKR